MRLLSVIPTMGIGGAETVVELLGRHALSRGDEVYVASTGGFRADALADAGAQLWSLPLTGRRPRGLARSVSQLRGKAARFPPTVVHAHNAKAALVARAACGRGVPVIATVHGFAAADYRPAARLLRLCADHVVGVSGEVAVQLQRHGYPEHRLSIIENALGPVPRHPRELARARLGLEPGSAVVLCVARMSAQKRHDLLIRAWSEVPDGTNLILAGDGPMRSRLQEQAVGSGHAEQIRFLGARSDVDWLLAAADLVVLPTDWEGLPMNILEAMSAGVAVIASHVAGLDEYFGSAVRFVDPGDAAALAVAINELLAHRPAREALARRGHALVAARFAPQPMLDAYADLFEQHIELSRGAQP